MSIKFYKIFIVHSWDDDYYYKKLIGNLNKINNIQYEDISLPFNLNCNELGADNISHNIRMRVRNADIVFIINTNKSQKSRWCAMEIGLSFSLCKKFIQVIPDNKVPFDQYICSEKDTIDLSSEVIEKTIINLF